MLNSFSRVFSVIVFATTCSSALAGPATQKMADCLVKQSTGQDRIELIQWMVLGYSNHPDVSSVVSAKEGSSEDVQSNVADVFTKLLLDQCMEETRAALKQDGDIALEKAFEALGRIAALELAQDRAVNEYLTGFTRYIDQARIAELYE